MFGKRKPVARARGVEIDLNAFGAHRSIAYRVHLGVTLLLRPCIGVPPRVQGERTITIHREVGTHVKVVVTFHLDEELFANPRMGRLQLATLKEDGVSNRTICAGGVKD